MKQAKKLTRNQKEIVAANLLNPDNWLFVSETEFYLKIRNKETGRERTITKFPRKYSKKSHAPFAENT